MATRDHGVGPPPGPRQPPSYLPGAAPAAPDSGGFMGMFGPSKDPEKFGPGKSVRRQDLGSVVGRRGPGLSQITGGDQDLHSVNHYGKKAPGGGGLGGLTGGGL